MEATPQRTDLEQRRLPPPCTICSAAGPGPTWPYAPPSREDATPSAASVVASPAEKAPARSTRLESEELLLLSPLLPPLLPLYPPM